MITSRTVDAQLAYDTWHASLACDPGSRTPWHDMIRAHLNEERDLLEKLVLEIGCGRGEFACWLASRPSRPSLLVAADLAGAAVSRGRASAQRQGTSTIHWNIADITFLPWPTASFDTVISCETIEHVGRPVLAVRELARVLKPGGRLYLTTTNYLNVWALYRWYLLLRGRRFSEAGQPINQFMLLPVTCAWVRRAGLRIHELDGICHWFPSRPGRAAIELKWLESARWLTRWIATQTMVVAYKPE